MPYTLRPAGLTDLPALPPIEKAAGILFAGTDQAWIVDEDPLPLATFERWFNRGVIWLAVDEAGRPVGFAAVEMVDAQGFLTELDVPPTHGRRGLGRRLIAAAGQSAAAQGATALRLSTFAHIPWNAPFYARLGFRVLADDELGPGLRAVRQHEADGGLEVAKRVLMTLPLTPATPRTAAQTA